MFLGIYNAPPDSEVEKELRGDIDDRADVDKLVKRAQNGDDEAFSSLVEIFEKFVYNTAVPFCCRSACGSRGRHSAELVYQGVAIAFVVQGGVPFFDMAVPHYRKFRAGLHKAQKPSPDRVADIIRRRRR